MDFVLSFLVWVRIEASSAHEGLVGHAPAFAHPATKVSINQDAGS
jgi:hypothetical protein